MGDVSFGVALVNKEVIFGRKFLVKGILMGCPMHHSALYLKNVTSAWLRLGKIDCNFFKITFWKIYTKN